MSNLHLPGNAPTIVSDRLVLRNPLGRNLPAIASVVAFRQNADPLHHRHSRAGGKPYTLTSVMAPQPLRLSFPVCAGMTEVRRNGFPTSRQSA
ncbi:hypothetical protein QLH51_15365 [Sphingomonas sp. 2R-10]|uniref:hypothetical protein n=1 Tax=Sphingomonas sp. 2R-10 TaxID=3045148 RepID=UPI000F7B211E|nr:hypothetical protein [Sphingomonas sp. 2R-10]MDJ0278177.1 hypothetical protein [Sphingomonas sp. 2R-10]